MTAARMALKALRLDTGVAFPALAVALGYYLAARLGRARTRHPHPMAVLGPRTA